MGKISTWNGSGLLSKCPCCFLLCSQLVITEKSNIKIDEGLLRLCFFLTWSTIFYWKENQSVTYLCISCRWTPVGIPSSTNTDRNPVGWHRDPHIHRCQLHIRPHLKWMFLCSFIYLFCLLVYFLFQNECWIEIPCHEMACRKGNKRLSLCCKRHETRGMKTPSTSIRLRAMQSTLSELGCNLWRDSWLECVLVIKPHILQWSLAAAVSCNRIHYAIRLWASFSLHER